MKLALQNLNVYLVERVQPLNFVKNKTFTWQTQDTKDTFWQLNY